MAALHQQQSTQRQQQKQSKLPHLQPVHQLTSQNSAPCRLFITHPSKTVIAMGDRLLTSSHDVLGSRSTDPTYHDPTGHCCPITDNYADAIQYPDPNPHAINAVTLTQAHAIPKSSIPTPRRICVHRHILNGSKLVDWGCTIHA